MARLTYEELENVKKKYNVSTLYSWSRINTYMTSNYEYFLKYVLHKKEDRDNCAYAPIGGAAHTVIEKLYGGEIEYEDMSEEFDDIWTTNIEIADLKFDRTDESKNASIGGKYKDNLEHFFRYHNMIKGNIVLEKFLAAKIGAFVLQGYADAITKDEDGNYVIIDWKTSSKYSGKTLEEKSGQLTVYAIALVQAGVPLKKIKACFNFLKYATIQYQQKNGAIKTRDVERSKIGESLQSNAKMWLKACGYEDEADDYLKLLIDTNSIEVLPEEVQAKYVISDCYVYIPLDQKLVDKWTDIIIATIRDICAREKDYEQDKNELVWWDSEESVAKESYYFANLCGFSPNLHKPYAQYIEKLEREKQGDDLFSGVGSYVDSMSAIPTSKNICDNNDDLDLSWLDEL